ncbi:MAG: FAD:protein FMN transferase [Treponema sp.]|nr:FAD:protein FMN transferase [Treponema sp.]
MAAISRNYQSALGYKFNFIRFLITSRTNKHERLTHYLSNVRTGSCWFAANVFLYILILTSCGNVESSRSEFALGTVCTITLFEHGKSRVYDDIFNRIREIENIMSVNIPASDINSVNASAGTAPVRVHDDLFNVIESAYYYADLSRGAFDPSVGPLVSLWGINSANPRIPSRAEIRETLPLINWRNIELDTETKSVFLKQRGMSLDLGAIAKGYAADEAAAAARRAGIKRAMIDLGGNIVIIGRRKDKNPWRVGIQNPDGNRGSVVGLVRTPEASVVTSGIYERFFEQDGTRYHHIFSPSSGYPADNELASVTIITQNSMIADALSTAVFALGYEQGSLLLERLRGVQAVFVFKDRSIRTTKDANFILTDRSYTVSNP